MLRDGQRERICRALCAQAGQPLGSGDMPRALTRALAQPLSRGEALMIETAMGVWVQAGYAPIGVLIRVLDPRLLRMIGSLLVALGDEQDNGVAVEAWLAKYEVTA